MTTSKHLLNIPFYDNVGNGKQCFQACIRSILAYYQLTDKTLEELDILCGRGTEQWTWTVQVAKTLHELGLQATYYSAEPIDPELDVKEYLQELMGENADIYIPLSNIESIEESVRWVQQHNKHVTRTTTQEDIKRWVDEGKPMIVLLDWSEISDKYTQYQGHAVVITGYDQEHIYIHQNGPTQPQANMAIPNSTFQRARNKETDHDLIVVHGVQS